MKVGAVTSLPYRLNVPRRWIFWSVLLFAVTFAVGFLQKLLPALQWGTFNIALNTANSPFADWLARVLDSVNQVAVVAVILLIVGGGLGLGTRLGLLRGVGTWGAIGVGGGERGGVGHGARGENHHQPGAARVCPSAPASPGSGNKKFSQWARRLRCGVGCRSCLGYPPQHDPHDFVRAREHPDSNGGVVAPLSGGALSA